MRDSQRSRVYASDDALYLWAKKNDKLVVFETVKDMQDFVRLVHAWTINEQAAGRPFAYAQPKLPTIEAAPRRARSSAYTHRGLIRMAGTRRGREQHWNNVIVIHELAHLYAAVEEKHGAGFCAVYLRFVQHFMGAASAAVLLDQFRQRGVKYRVAANGLVKPKKVLTPEQKAELVARLQKARAAKQLAREEVAA